MSEWLMNPPFDPAMLFFGIICAIVGCCAIVEKWASIRPRLHYAALASFIAIIALQSLRIVTIHLTDQRIPTTLSLKAGTWLLPQSFGADVSMQAALCVAGSIGIAIVLAGLSDANKRFWSTSLILFSLITASIGLYGKIVNTIMIDTYGVGRYTWAGFLYENHAAVAMLIGFILLLEKPNITKIFGMCLIGIAILMTQCRAATILMCLTVSLRLIMHNRKLLWPICTITCLGVAIFALTVAKDLDRHIDGSYRLAKIQTASKMVRDYPLFGLGWQGYANAVMVYRKVTVTVINGRHTFADPADRLRYSSTVGAADVNCDYLQYLVEFGLIGCGLIAFILFHLLRGPRRFWPFLAFSCCAIIALIDLPFHSPTLCLLTGILIGIIRQRTS